MHTNVLNLKQKIFLLHDTCYLMNINISSLRPLLCRLLHLPHPQNLTHGFLSLMFPRCLFLHLQTRTASTRKVLLPSLHSLQVISTPLPLPLSFTLLICLAAPHHLLLPLLVCLQPPLTLLTLSFLQHLNLSTAPIT